MHHRLDSKRKEIMNVSLLRKSKKKIVSIYRILQDHVTNCRDLHYIKQTLHTMHHRPDSKETGNHTRIPSSYEIQKLIVNTELSRILNKYVIAGTLYTAHWYLTKTKGPGFGSTPKRENQSIHYMSTDTALGPNYIASPHALCLAWAIACM